MVFTTPTISWMEFIGGGRLKVGRKPKAGKTIHREANSSGVSSAGHRETATVKLVG